MTQQQASDLESATIRAHKRGIVILAHGRRRTDGVRIFLTNSGSLSDGTHFVTLVGNRLTCDCAARTYCVHRAIVRQRLLAEYQAAQLALATRPTAKAGPEQAAPRTDNRPFSIFK
jgi:hypothetical protein